VVAAVGGVVIVEVVEVVVLVTGADELMWTICESEPLIKNGASEEV